MVKKIKIESDVNFLEFFGSKPEIIRLGCVTVIMHINDKCYCLTRWNDANCLDDDDKPIKGSGLHAIAIMKTINYILKENKVIAESTLIATKMIRIRYSNLNLGYIELDDGEFPFMIEIEIPKEFNEFDIKLLTDISDQIKNTAEMLNIQISIISSFNRCEIIRETNSFEQTISFMQEYLFLQQNNESLNPKGSKL